LSELIHRQEGAAVLVGVDFGLPHFDSELEELGLLAQTAGLTPVARITCKRKAPDAALFVGSGKADEIKELAAMHQGERGHLRPVPEPGAAAQPRAPARHRGLRPHLAHPRNLRPARAFSHEGKLQVELARLQYLSTRLVRRWSHLERQTGGAGVRGGPGEKQIELDRRMINESIKRTRERLAKVQKQRGTQRRQRERRETFNISLVGYTNAGKSSLFNALVKARAYAADQLFATLDTTTRNLYLGDARRQVSISDTVGFIRDLPHGLVDAFKATLQEAVDADLLLHVVDASNPHYPEQMAEVQRVLREIGADAVPQLLVFNKLDALESAQHPLHLQDEMEIEGVQVPRIFLSAKSGEGVPLLRAELARQSGSVADTMTPEARH
jgi:GTP-binding protein HflX